ncbi:MAG: AlpA family phage regulatory protein [Mariprofundaceae bacterium]|nr:AlpA family phage regulatory protein [Mariprofundaceae bacterium]
MKKEKCNNMMDTGFLRLPQVLQHIPVSKTIWYKGVAAGRYPKPIKLSERTSAWRVEDIRNLIEELGAKSC